MKTNNFGDRIGTTFDNNIRYKMWTRVHNQVFDMILSLAKHQILNRIEYQIWNKVFNQIREQIRRNNGNK